MKRLMAIAAAAVALAAVSAFGAWVYEGKWGSEGTGNGQFDCPSGIATAGNGTVYVADVGNDRIQYFKRSRQVDMELSDSGESAVVPASLGRVKALFR